MASPNTQEPVLAPDTHLWFEVRGAYRLAIRSAMSADEGTPGTNNSGGACGPSLSYTCNYINEGFTNVDEFNPEYQLGAWPESNELYKSIAQAFTDKKPASTTIPLQLQANTLESYRRQLLHKKWRKCHHLNAVNASLVAEFRSQDEIEKLLLGQQVGNTSPPET